MKLRLGAVLVLVSLCTGVGASASGGHVVAADAVPAGDPHGLGHCLLCFAADHGLGLQRAQAGQARLLDIGHLPPPSCRAAAAPAGLCGSAMRTTTA